MAAIVDDGDVVLGQANIWLFDFLCYKAWHEFEEHSTVDQKTGRQYLLGTFAETGGDDNDDVIKAKRLFVTLLCQLADGTECCANYLEDLDEKKTSMEWALSTCGQLSDAISHRYPSLMTPLSAVRESIRVQAVATSCQTGHFSCAGEVFDKVFTSPEVSKSAVARLLSKIISSEDWDNDFLQNQTYEAFLEEVKIQMSHVYNVLFCVKKGLPFIVHTAALVQWRRGHDIPDKYKEQIESTTDEVVTSHSRLESNKMTNRISDDDSADDCYDRVISRARMNELYNRLGMAQRLTDDERSEMDKQIKQIRQSYGKVDKPLTCRVGHVPVVPAFRRSLVPVTKTKNYSSKYVSSLRKFWSDEESEKLFLAVKHCGNNWAKIKEDYRFHLRTNVNLKDRWRSMQKLPIYKQLLKKHGKP